MWVLVVIGSTRRALCSRECPPLEGDERATAARLEANPNGESGDA